MERDHLPPVREQPDEISTLKLSQIEVKSYVGGPAKSFGRKAAQKTHLETPTLREAKIRRGT